MNKAFVKQNAILQLSVRSTINGLTTHLIIHKKTTIRQIWQGVHLEAVI